MSQASSGLSVAESGSNLATADREVASKIQAGQTSQTLALDVDQEAVQNPETTGEPIGDAGNSNSGTTRDYDVPSKHGDVQEFHQATIEHSGIPHHEPVAGFETDQFHHEAPLDHEAVANGAPATNHGAAEPQDATPNSPIDQVDAIDLDMETATNHEGATNLEIDSDETDSAIGDMTPISSTASLRSSIFDAVQENGRTYHRYKEGKYLLPNDEVEQERLDLQHHLCLLSLNGRLHLAPTGPDLRNVLDIGTGTGIWAIEYAMQNPTVNVIGSDLSPIQPTFVPINCRFEVDDAEDEWTYSHKFDFIHGRMLFSCFKDPAGVIASAFQFLEPGRYLEMMDVSFPFGCIDDSMKGTALGKWCTMLIQGAEALGKDWTCTSKYPKFFEDAGFVEVQVVKYHWPTNSWAKSEHQKILGRWLQQNLLDGVSAMSMAALTRGLKMSPQEVELFLIDVRNDIQNRHIHSYCPVDVVYGRKPD